MVNSVGFWSVHALQNQNGLAEASSQPKVGGLAAAAPSQGNHSAPVGQTRIPNWEGRLELVRRGGSRPAKHKLTRRVKHTQKPGWDA
jgi:hypothetical protein